MHILTKGRISEAIEKYPQAASALKSWYSIMKKSEPKDFADLKCLFPAVDKVGKYHVFDIGGNKIRLIAVVKFQGKKLYIRHVLSHKEYDKNQWKED
ncbi:type II toxin-antitoxin system HigB family toxin [Acinetobacter sp. 3657]|uniref:type II toxin-antitoxin system HigB family toxin n=1 Tax=Acinetobacter sp. 3657 TaxID=2817764 RepID=UPI00285CF5A9|nr:mRNA interferase HigB [Prolinoborus sp. 3657]